MSKVPITMPVLSDTMESGQLANWLKKPGDLVKKGDVLAEVESDKAIMDVEAFSDGYLAGPLAKVGSEIPVGQIIGYITDSPDKTDAKREPPVSIGPSANKKDIPSETVTPKPTVTSAPVHATARFDDNTEVKISPYARGLAQDLGIDPT
ncbi:MAG TPA: biotin/lipoyl-binding protein, partial [Thiolapillus brandeum]|nr:biotin/lipoyl-binding protein [Thiolapillus brandeum]